ncbi:MAG: phosphoglucomutase, alpha-D-glucose phosphate-specific [Candidatus Rokubacteria bacterium 13_1_40CM_68_15]|nr:MAG: phosphoglucomutase, alpha-D-glucose phosphate-specific [Candidatus Rokubacteria bacterium 13_1_40CM_68_15]
MKTDPLAGRPAPPSLLVDVPKLLEAYYAERPDPSVPAQWVVFGTSGHRGSSLKAGFNEAHILAITQAICLYRQAHGIDGPLFLGRDTHALSEPARATALEVLAANGVEVMLDAHDGVTPTPVVSQAILAHNRGRTKTLADGIVITPSHNPPEYGGFKYDPPSGGPADTPVTEWIESRANAFLADGLRGVARIPYERARQAATTHRFDYLTSYVEALAAVIDMDVLRGTTLKIGVDPLGGASLGYWQPIGDRYGFALDVVNREIDPTFRFMTVDWDGAIRMDPSSPYAMARLIGLRDRFDLAFATDPDADRHGIVSRSVGLLNPNQYLAASIWYLFRHRPSWPNRAAIGKTIVSSSMIDRVTAQLGRRLVEVPVGFKYFVDGLLEGSLGFAGEESAGASFLQRDGTVWTTDKDGLVMGLLAMEMTARTGRDPGECYQDLTRELGEPVYERIDAPATAEQKAALARMSAKDLAITELAGDPVTAVLTTAPGDGRPFGGIKVMTEHGWFAARPSGTEAVYKLYAESFKGVEHLRRIQEQAQAAIERVFRARAA